MEGLRNPENLLYGLIEIKKGHQQQLLERFGSLDCQICARLGDIPMIAMGRIQLMMWK